MAEWSLPELDCPINDYDSYHCASYPSYYQHNPVPRVPYYPPPQAQTYQSASSAVNMAMHFAPQQQYDSSAAPAPVPKRENPREIRNKAEKMRRDRLNQSVAELAAMVPPVLAARRKIDKTTVLRLTAHYLRAHQYVFGDSIGQSATDFNPASILKVLNLFNGFLITMTYRGIIVVVSQNVHEYLGYTELDLLGQNLLNITHEDDRAMLRDQLMPKTQTLGPNGELLIRDEPNAISRVQEALAQEKRRFIVRLKKLGQRSEPSQYVTCHVEGSLRKSDRACRGYSRCCQIVRRARARSENPCSSGNDIVFIGIVRPTSETFINESALESYRMEYRTRHSIDGEIIQCESRIALVTGYMTHEVSGVNAMNFMHRNDVRWVIIALREMYDHHRLFGESCYRLITKNGQFIYMRTRGCLDVDQDSRAVTSFVCTNTVVHEEEGKELIKLMKRKFTLMVNNNGTPAIESIDDDSKDEEEPSDNQSTPIEDPKRLEQVILHLVTNLPSPSPQEREEETFTAASPEKCLSPHHLTIIPPNKERILSAIEKIYSVFKTIPKSPDQAVKNEEKSDRDSDLPLEFQDVFESKEAQAIVPYENCNSITDSVDASEIITAPSVAFNGSENEYHSESVLIGATPPDMGYFDGLPSAFSNIPSIFGSFDQIGEEILNEQLATAATQEDTYKEMDIALDMAITDFLNESNYSQVQPQPSTSKYSCGIKRPGDFEDVDVICKKKNTEINGTNGETSTSVLVDLKQLFDKNFGEDEDVEITANGIELVDPPFPDIINFIGDYFGET